MFIEATPNQYTLYTLTTQAGYTLHVGIVPFNQLTALSDVPDSVQWKPADITYLSIIQSDPDRNKLANVGLAWTMEKGYSGLHDRLTQAIESWPTQLTRKGVECIETGETWAAATEAARAHDLTYGALLKHLSGEKSFNTVKGRTYRRVGV